MVPRARTAHMLANSIRCMSACASQAGRQGEPESLGSSVVVERMEREALGSLSGSLDQIEFVSIDPGRSIAAQVRGVDINPKADRRRNLYGIKVGDEILRGHATAGHLRGALLPVRGEQGSPGYGGRRDVAHARVPKKRLWRASSASSSRAGISAWTTPAPMT